MEWCNCLGDGKHIHEGKILIYKDGTNKNKEGGLNG